MSDRHIPQSSNLSGSGDESEEIVEIADAFSVSDEDALMDDVADQLARSEASNYEPNPQSVLTLYSQTDSQLEPSKQKSKLRKNPPKVKNPTPPLTPSLKKKGRPLKKPKPKSNYPSPALIRKMEATVRQRPTILIDAPTQNPITPPLTPKSLKKLPKIPKIPSKPKSPDTSKIPLSKSGNPLISKKPVQKSVTLGSSSLARSPSPTFSSDEELEQPIPSKEKSKLKSVGNKNKNQPKKRVTFTNLGGGDFDNFDKILADAATVIEMMAPDVQTAIAELLKTRPRPEVVSEPEIVEYHESDPLSDEICEGEIDEVVTENETVDIGPEILETTVTPVTSRPPSTGLTPEIRVLDLERPLDIVELNRNISQLNTILTQGFGRVVSFSKTTKRDKSRESSVLHKIPEVILETVNLNEEYNIVKVLAEGYFAKIFLADNRRTNTTVVLKGVHAELTSLKDFYREYHYSYHLSPHPNILSTYSVAFKSDDFYIFAQEFAPYGDLAGTVKAGGLCEEFCKRIAFQLCSALEFVHSKQLVHRDVKLENVLVFAADFSKLKLCDFGETRKEGTQVAKVKCTWQPFLPPEQCDVVPNEKFPCRRYSDCWQAAIVLFVCATGNTPWQIALLTKNSEYQNFTKWQKRRTTKVPSQFKKFTPRLLRMFRRLLAHKPEDRAEITEPFKYMKDAWFETKSGQNTPIERKNSEDICIVDDDDDDDIRIEMDESRNRMAKVLSSYGLETTVDQKSMSKRLQEWVLSCDNDYQFDSKDESY